MQNEVRRDNEPRSIFYIKCYDATMLQCYIAHRSPQATKGVMLNQKNVYNLSLPH